MNHSFIMYLWICEIQSKKQSNVANSLAMLENDYMNGNCLGGWREGLVSVLVSDGLGGYREDWIGR